MNEWPNEPGAARVSDAASTAGGEDPAQYIPTDGVAAPDAGGNALRRTIRISNSRGLHARAAAKLVALAERFSACIHVSKGGESVPACSIMGLMMLGAGKGSDITIEAEGWDAREALDAVAGLVEAGFHED
jgi:phosphocarrier protein